MAVSGPVASRAEVVQLVAHSYLFALRDTANVDSWVLCEKRGHRTNSRPRSDRLQSTIALTLHGKCCLFSLTLTMHGNARGNEKRTVATEVLFTLLTVHCDYNVNYSRTSCFSLSSS